jgi:antiviral defense system Shedu protein SduA
LPYYAFHSGDSSQEFHAFNPPSVVIAGSTQEIGGRAKTKAFELFRGGLRDIQVITFDELYAKLKTLVELLDGPSPPDAGMLIDW